VLAKHEVGGSSRPNRTIFPIKYHGPLGRRRSDTLPSRVREGALNRVRVLGEVTALLFVIFILGNLRLTAATTEACSGFPELLAKASRA